MHTYRLVTSASVTYGEIQIMHVGGVHGRWEFCPVSNSLSEAIGALSTCSPGEVIIHESCCDYFEEDDLMPAALDGWRVVSGVWSTPNHDRKVARRACELRHYLQTQLRMDSMKAYIPGAIWSKLLAGDAAWIVAQGSVRTVTLLTMRLEVTTVDDPLVKVAAYTSLVHSTHPTYPGHLHLIAEPR